MSKTQQLSELYKRTEKDLAPYVRFGTVVFGIGDPDADLVLIGEAPGKNEAEQGIPFVGAAGKTLDALLSAHGILRESVYITNIVKYRPVQDGARPGTFRNRTPAEKSCRFAEHFFWKNSRSSLPVSSQRSATHLCAHFWMIRRSASATCTVRL